MFGVLSGAVSGVLLVDWWSFLVQVCFDWFCFDENILTKQCSPGMSVEQIRGVVLLNIILLQQWSVLMIRSRSMFLSAESCRPGWLLLLFLCLNSLAGTLLVAFWPFGSGIEAVSWNNILQVWIISGIALLGKDLIKLLYRLVFVLFLFSP